MHEILAFLSSRAATREDRHGRGPFPEKTLRQLAEVGSTAASPAPDEDDPEGVEGESERGGSAGGDG